MPYTKSKRKYTRKKRAYARRKFIPRGLAIKRSQQISTKTFYFKANGTIHTDVSGNINAAWLTKIVHAATPTLPSYLTPPAVADWKRVASLYSEYKVLALRIKLFPSNVGTEADLPGLSTNPFQRGNALTYFDQSLAQGQTLQTNLQQVLNLGSSKMFTPRRFHTRTINRPKGFPGWGECDPEIPAPTRKSDPWWGGIFLLINGATPNSPPISFHQVIYKVIFRGRNITRIPTDPLEIDADLLVNPPLILDP